MFDTETFINDVDPDYSSNVSHILFLASDLFNELDDFGVNQRSNTGGYAVIYVRLDIAQKSLSLVNSWSMTDYYPGTELGLLTFQQNNYWGPICAVNVNQYTSVSHILVFSVHNDNLRKRIRQDSTLFTDLHWGSSFKGTQNYLYIAAKLT